RLNGRRSLQVVPRQPRVGGARACHPWEVPHVLGLASDVVARARETGRTLARSPHHRAVQCPVAGHTRGGDLHAPGGTARTAPGVSRDLCRLATAHANARGLQGIELLDEAPVVDRRITVSCSRTSIDSNPRASYMDRGPRKWPASLFWGLLSGYASIHAAPRAEASAIARSSSAEAIPCRRNGGARTENRTPRPGGRSA